MKIFLRCHGQAMSRDTLLRFVRKGLRGPWYAGFRELGEIGSCLIVRVMDLSGRQIEYHGLVEVRPARLGWQVMQRLNGRRLMGQQVQARKWFDRTSQGADRRRLEGLQAYPMDQDRRRDTDRRRMVRVQFLKEVPEVVIRQPARARR